MSRLAFLMLYMECLAREMPTEEKDYKEYVEQAMKDDLEVLNEMLDKMRENMNENK